MAMNTYMTFLMKSTDGSAYTDLVPIKDYPDFLNEVNTIDVTNLQFFHDTNDPVGTKLNEVVRQ